MIDYLKDSWYLLVRLTIANLRMPVFVIMSIVQPVLWMVLFGQLFRSVIEVPGFGADSYIQFLTPGIAVMTALYGAAFTGMGLLAEIDSGFLDRLLATPVRRGAIISARIGVAATQVIVQATILLLMALLMGARPHGGAFGLMIVYLAAALLGGAFAALSSALALVSRRQELIIAIMNFIVMPAIFLSGIMMTPDLMPGWIRAVSRVNPVNWAVTAGRHGFEGGEPTSALLNLALVALFALACGGLATRAFGAYQRSL